MKKVVKVARIGNSRGIRLNRKLLDKYGIRDSLILEEAADYIVLKPIKRHQLTWEETYREMAAEDQDWGDWEAISGEDWPHED